MVDFTPLETTMFPLHEKSVELIICNDKVGVGWLFFHIMNKPYLSFCEHGIEFLFKDIEWEAGHAGQDTTVDVVKGFSVSVMMELELDGVAGFVRVAAGIRAVIDHPGRRAIGR